MVKAIKQRVDVILDTMVLVFSETKYLVIAFALAVAMGITYPLLFPLAVGKNVSILAFRGSLLDTVVLVSISTLFGVIVAMQLYKFKRISKDYKKTGANLVSTAIGFVTSKACCLLPLLLLAVGATTGIAFFVRYTTEIRLVGLAVLGLVLYWTSLDISKNKGCCVVS